MNGETQSFKYFAFISYSHKDMAIARRMQHELESYKLPSAIQKNKDRVLPKKISPIFRDETDLSVGDLDKNLQEELEQSRYLIVICSPNSASPNEDGKNYVNGEVEHFCKIGRSDFIIPVIVGGTPNEAFCPKLKELGKLALDATKTPRARIVNDIVAKVLGLRPDELWRREKRRIVRRRIALASFLLVGMIASAAIGFCAWDYKRDVRRYFSEIEQKFGIARGKTELSESEAKKLNRYFCFHYQGYGFPPFLGGIRTLRRRIEVTSTGNREEQYSYSDDGNLAKVVSLDMNGGITEVRVYSDGKTNSCEVVEYESGSPKLVGGERLYIDFDEHSGMLAHVRSRHFDGKHELISYRNEGQEELREFFNADGTRGCDQYGTAIKLHLKPKDSPLMGVTREAGQLYFDAYTNRFVNAQGVSGFMYKLDITNRVFDVVYIDEANAPVDSVQGYATERTYLDTSGRPVQIWRLNSNGEKVENAEIGCYGVNMSYNLFDGRLDKTMFTDKNGEIMFSDVLLFAEMRYSYSGNIQHVRYYGMTNNPCVMQNGTAGHDVEFTQDGRTREIKYVDVSGTICTNIEGVARREYKYDQNGRLVEQIIMDAQTRPALFSTPFGTLPIDKISISYDGAGNMVKETSFADKTFLGDRVKFYCRKSAPDGRQMSEWYCDSERKICDSKLGYARMIIAYNEAGEWVEITHLNEQNELALNEKWGVCKIMRTVKHKENGIFSEIRYLGAESFPVADGTYAVDARYTPTGKLIETHARDALARPALLENTNASHIRIDMDDRSRIVRLEGTPLGPGEAFRDGYSIADFEYSKDGKNIKTVLRSRQGNVVSVRMSTLGELRRTVLKKLDALSFKPLPDVDVLTLHDRDVNESLRLTPSHALN